MYFLHRNSCRESPLIYGLPNTHNEHQQDQVLTNKCRSNNHLKWAIVCVEKSIHLCMNWYLRLEENHKFFVIETPRSVLFFNRVISSFACPKKNLKSQSSTQKDSMNPGIMQLHEIYRNLAQNLHVIFEEWL